MIDINYLSAQHYVSPIISVNYDGLMKSAAFDSSFAFTLSGRYTNMMMTHTHQKYTQFHIKSEPATVDY